MSDHRMRLIVAGAAGAALFAFSSTILAQTSQPSARAARTPDGKPNFAGLWAGGGGGAQAAGGRRPTRAQLARELPLTDWGREQVRYITSGDGEFGGETGAPEDPRFHNLCGGPMSPSVVAPPVEIVQNPRRLFLVYMGNFTRAWLRQIWIGREHPKDPTDYNPTWMGHSVGKWDRDTLVVDTIGIREGTLVDRGLAAPHSEQLHMVERFQLADAETLRVERTFEDPKAYTRPWTNRSVYKLQTDWDEIAEDWEVVDQHTVCEGGTYPKEHDPWWTNEEPTPGKPSGY